MQRAVCFDRLRQSDTQPVSLGQYRLLDELGRGGMGRVYKALHTIMGREVALKVISPELVSDPIAVAWFLREVRACTQLHHPNIVMAYDANEAEGLYFLVMEYVRGATLDTLVKQHGHLQISYVCEMMRQTALGLQHAHEKGMVHRDIKPSNLLVPLPPTPLVGEGRCEESDVLVKILDFGLARLHGQTKGDTIALRGEAGVLGTPDYIAPEQSRDIHAADIRSDLYSLGCVFYFTLTGHVPFRGENAMEKLIKHLTEQPEPIERMRPDVPPQVSAIVRKLMAKNPADRYQTPAELAHELEKVSGTFSEKLPDTTFLPSSQPPSDLQPSHTCVLDKIAIFEPPHIPAVPSSPSLLESLWQSGPDVQRRPDSHETQSPSLPGDTEEVTAVAMGNGLRRLQSDSTFQEMAVPENPADSKVQASHGEPLPPIDPVVFRLWRRWTALLETIVVEGSLARLDNDTYQTIHALLLQACRAAIDACSVSERRAFYEECLSLAQPWLKPQSFVHADAAMLNSLLRRSKEIEVELNNGKALWTARQAIGLALLAFCPAGTALWYWYSGRYWLPSLLRVFHDDFSVSSLQSAWNFLQAHPTLLMGVLFPLVIVFSVVLLLRTPRT